MKIGIVCYPSIGGSGIVATELGKGLLDRGHEIHFFSYDLPERLNGYSGRFHFHHIDVPLYPVFRFPPYTLALATAIAEIAEKENLDLIHVHYAIPHSTSALLAKLMTAFYQGRDLKIITTLHGTDIDLVGWEPSYRKIVEYSINSSDAVTAVSHYLKVATLEKFRIHRQIEVIHNPIDTEVFRPDPDREGPNPGVRRILHVSNFRPVKRVVDAVKILDIVRSCCPLVELVFLGDGPDRSEAERTAQQLGVTDRVRFIGKASHVENWFREADLLLSTSEMESFGMSIAEAMASGVPVVAYRVGGVPEVAEDGVEGRLVGKGEICSAATAVNSILSNPVLWRQYSEAARAKVVDRFRLDRITGEYEKVYERVLKQPSLNPCDPDPLLAELYEGARLNG